MQGYTVLENKSVQEAILDKYRPAYWKAWCSNNNEEKKQIELEVNVCRYKDYNTADLNLILQSNKTFKRIPGRYA